MRAQKTHHWGQQILGKTQSQKRFPVPVESLTAGVLKVRFAAAAT
jgi:hypothetical protein